VRAHGRRRRHAAWQGRRLAAADSDERARSKQSASTSTNDIAGLLTSLRFSRGASRWQKDGDGGDRRERSARVPATAAARERATDRVWGRKTMARARPQLYRDRRRPRHAGPWPGARAGAGCDAAGFELELVWLRRLKDGDDDRDPAEGWGARCRCVGPLLGWKGGWAKRRAWKGRGELRVHGRTSVNWATGLAGLRLQLV
jgi:hypothetical protein